MGNLAATLHAQGDFAGARQLSEQVVEGLTRVLGPGHPNTLTAVANFASTLKAEGDLDGAHQREEQVVEGLTRILGAEHPETLNARGNLAVTLHAQGDLAGARQRFEEIVEGLTRIFGSEHPDTLTAEANLAAILQAQGDLTGARQREEQVVKVRARTLGAEHPDTLTAIFNLAGSLYALGDFAGARQRLEQVTEARTRILGAEHPDTLATIANLAVTLRAQGDLDGAHQREKRVLKILTRNLGSEHPDTLTVVANFAATLKAQGDLSGARQREEQVVAARTRSLGAEHPDTLKALVNLALTLDAQGDLAGARQRFEHVVEVLTRILGAEHPDTLTALANLASTLKAQGDLTGARQRFEHVVEVETRILGAEHPNTLTALANLASTLKAQGDLAGARQRFEHVVEVRIRILGAEHPDTLTALANLASALEAQEDLAGARQHEEHVVEVRTRILGSEHPDTLAAMHNLAGTLLDLGELDDAQELFEQVAEGQSRLRVQESRSSVLLDGQPLVGLAKIHHKKGDVKRARQYLFSSLDALENQARQFDFSEETRNVFRARYEPTYREAITFFLEQEWLDDAFHVLERYRGQDLLTLLHWNRTRAANERSAEEDSEYETLYLRHAFLTREIDRRGEDVPTELLTERSNLLREIQIRRGQEMRQLDESKPLGALQVDEIRQNLEPGTAMLAYSVASYTALLEVLYGRTWVLGGHGGSADRVHLYVLTKEKPLVVVPLPVTATELRSQISKFFSLLQSPEKSRALGLEETVELADPEARLTMSRWLYDRLIAPASKHFEDAERLAILPDGVLYYLPFAALVRPTDGTGGWQYLVEWKPLHTVQSATVYAELRKRRLTSVAPRTLVALGDPSYPPPEIRKQPETKASAAGRMPKILRSAQERGLFKGWDPLPNTRREVESIASLFQDRARVFLGSDATEENAKAALPSARYAHFATHGLADPQQPRHSFLALTIPEGLPPKRENGLLQAWEIVDQLRLDTDLVVLSACVTALGPLQTGEGLMSLSRAFQVAGARTVAASLWPVADASTAELMIRFYGHLLEGVPKDEALRAAQLELIHDGPFLLPDGEGGKVERDFSSPYYWAAFQLIGDWR